MKLVLRFRNICFLDFLMDRGLERWGFSHIVRLRKLSFLKTANSLSPLRRNIEQHLINLHKRASNCYHALKMLTSRQSWILPRAVLITWKGGCLNFGDFQDIAHAIIEARGTFGETAVFGHTKSCPDSLSHSEKKRKRKKAVETVSDLYASIV